MAKRITALLFSAALLSALLFLPGCGKLSSGSGALSMTFAMLDDGTDRYELRVTNNSDQDWCYGRFYTLQRREGLRWETIPVMGGVRQDYNSLRHLAPGESFTDMDGLWMHGPLEPGRYRFIMEFASGDAFHCGWAPDKYASDYLPFEQIYDPPEDTERARLSAEFTLLENFVCNTSNYTDEFLRRQEAGTEQLERLTEYFRSVDKREGQTRESVSTYPGYGGAYFNTDGDLVVLVCFDYYIDVLREAAGNPNLLMRTVLHQYSDLVSVMGITKPLMAKPELGFDLRQTWVDTYHNCIQAAMTTVNDDTVGAFCRALQDRIYGLDEEEIAGLFRFTEATGEAVED